MSYVVCECFLQLVDMLLLGFRVSIQSHQCGISLLALTPLPVRISCTPILQWGPFYILTNAITLNRLIRKGIPSSFRQKVWLSLPDAAKKKSIFLESYYLLQCFEQGGSGKAQATRQIDHVSLIFSKSSWFFCSSGKLMYFICS